MPNLKALATAAINIDIASAGNVPITASDSSSVTLDVTQIGGNNYISDSELLCRYRGSVATMENLPSTPEIGDIYNVIITGINYVWSGSFWDAMYEKEYTVATNYDIEELF